MRVTTFGSSSVPISSANRIFFPGKSKRAKP